MALKDLRKWPLKMCGIDTSETFFAQVQLLRDTVDMKQYNLIYLMQGRLKLVKS